MPLWVPTLQTCTLTARDGEVKATTPASTNAAGARLPARRRILSLLVCAMAQCVSGGGRPRAIPRGWARHSPLTAGRFAHVRRLKSLESGSHELVRLLGALWLTHLRARRPSRCC